LPDAIDDSVEITTDQANNGDDNVVNVLLNDSIGDVQATTNNVTIILASTTVTDVDGNNITDVVTMDSNGDIDIAATSSTVSYTLTYWICDKVNTENCDSAVVVIQIVPVPELTDDTTSTTRNVSVTVPVFENDGYVPETSTLTVTTPVNGAVTVTDPNNTPNNPNDDVVVYTPDDGFIGVDTFIYQICDINNNCKTATVTVDIRIPLNPDLIDDPQTPSFTVAKTASSNNVVIGDIVHYQLIVTNIGLVDATITVSDTPAQGLQVLENTVNIEDSDFELMITNENGNVIISGKNEDLLVAVGESIKITYDAMVGPGAFKGALTNLATIEANGSPVSDESQAVVYLVDDPIFDMSSIIGKVYNDKNGNGAQDPGEPGMPGVRLATVSGEVILTDRFGRYHIIGLESDVAGAGKNYILKLDEASLPSCAKVISENPRVVRLTSGLMSRLDFMIDMGEQTVVEHKQKTTLIDTIYFANADHAISADQLRRIDDELQKYLRDPNIRVRISGHTDSDRLKSRAYIDKYRDNYGLSQFRAQAVGNEIIEKLNLPTDRIEFAGYGPDRPVASNDTEVGQAKNRRGEIEIVSFRNIQKTVSSCGAKLGSIAIPRSQAASGSNTLAPSTVEKPVKVTLTDVFYQTNSSEPRNPEKFGKLIDLLRKRGTQVTIVARNQQLGLARAEMLRKLLPSNIDIKVQ
jgi:uncharacterized repeat protein (TIGR01451 family)